MKRWIKRLWSRPMIKSEAWDYMTCKVMSEETFLDLMRVLRKEARKLYT